MARVFSQGRWAGAAIALLGLLLVPIALWAEGLGGYLEYGYSRTSTRTEPTGDVESRFDVETLLQRYNLSLDRSLYPQLRFTGGVLLEKSDSTLSMDADELDSSVRKFSPRADLSLGSASMNAGIGYNRTDEMSETSRTPRFDDVRENYNARFALLPLALPSLDLRAARNNAFDKDRAFQDRSSDSLTLMSQYKPGKDLNISYIGQYTDTTDHIAAQEMTTLMNNGRVTYGRRFLDNRASFATTYNVAYQQDRVSGGGGGGSFLTPLPFALQGLFAAGGNLLFGALALEPLLTDNNPTISDTAAQERFKIGAFIPESVDTTTPVSFGLDLTAPVAISTLFLPLNQDLAQEIATPDNLFAWRLFVSDNGIDWVETAIGHIRSTYHRFAVAGNTYDHSYELSFPQLTTRFIKVTTTPPPALPFRITPGSNVIYVTELQAFLSEEVASRPDQTNSFLSQLLNLNGRLQLLESPNLVYELNFSTQRSRSDLYSASRLLLSNGISAAHRFNDIFSGTARIAREDSSDDRGHQWGIAYSTALNATPLPTLNHALVVSGRHDQTLEGTTNTIGLYLTNTATLYRGIDLNLGGGVSRTDTADEQLDSTSLNAGAAFDPHPALNIGVNHNSTSNHRSGGELPDTSFTSQRNEVTATLTPASSLYLTAALAILSESDRPTVTTKNFGGSWGLLRDGTLLANFSYNESYNSESRQTNRSLVPNLRWNIRRGSYLDLSYVLARNHSDVLQTESRAFSANLRMAF